MGVKVTGIPFDRYSPLIEGALDKGLAAHLALTQRELADGTPKDTARAASSWFVEQGQPSSREAPERDGPGSVSLPPFNTAVSIKKDSFITNNLPYIERLATDVDGGKWNKNRDWYTRIANQNQRKLSETA